MTEALEQTDLSDGCRGHAIILLLEPDFLEGYNFSCCLLPALVHDSVRAFTKLLNALVFLKLACFLDKLAWLRFSVSVCFRGFHLS